MAIKRVSFRKLITSVTNFTDAAIGGIRFYDQYNQMIPSGNLLSGYQSSSATYYQHFAVWASQGKDLAMTAENPGNAFHTAKPQAVDNATTRGYYWQGQALQELVCEFVTPVEMISRIEFNATPSRNEDRGVDSFTIEVEDEAGKTIASYNVTNVGGTVRNVIRSINTPELTPSQVTLMNEDKTVPKNNDYAFRFRISPKFPIKNEEKVFEDLGTLGAGRLRKVQVSLNDYNFIQKMEVL